ncbi:MAG TPA: ParA family protein [Syntrophorhabdus sp.]|nr:ParA family protein [Syntrophorhabdus sp.]
MSVYNGKSRVIPIANHKGGSGKTTTCSNLGAALAREGRKVLLIDFDTQSNLTLALLTRLQKNRPTIRELMAEQNTFSQVVQEYNDKLHVLPSSYSLTDIEKAIRNNHAKLPDLKKHNVFFYLRIVLEKINEAYDYVLIDCSPSTESFLLKNALAACTEIFIATEAEVFSLKGATVMEDLVRSEIYPINTSARVSGVVITRHTPNLILPNAMVSQIHKRFTGRVFRTTIRNSIKIKEAQTLGLSIFDHKPYSSAGQDYTELASEVIQMEDHTAKEIS